MAAGARMRFLMTMVAEQKLALHFKTKLTRSTSVVCCGAVCGRAVQCAGVQCCVLQCHVLLCSAVCCCAVLDRVILVD